VKGLLRSWRAVGVSLTFMAVIAVVLCSNSAYSAESSSDRMSISEPASEIVVGGAKNPRPTLTMNLTVSGTIPATVEIGIVDLYSGASGSKQSLPAGTSPYSLQGAISLSSTSLRYVPSAEGTVFHIQVTPTTSTLDALRFGGVQFTLKQQTSANSGALTSQSSIVMSLVLTPSGYSGGLPAGGKPQLDIGDVNLASNCDPSLLWQLLPDIPGVLDCTPISATVQIKNAGKLPGMVSTSWDFVSGGQDLAKSVSPAHLVVPGQELEVSTRSVNHVTGRAGEVNAAPFIGVVEVTAVANFELAGENQGSASGSGSVLVLPWKFPAFALIIACFVAGIVLFSVVLWRRRHPKQVTYRPFPWKV
jgi:hypothetical protein